MKANENKWGRLQHSFWRDPFIQHVCTTEQAYFYSYLIAGPMRTLCGVFYFEYSQLARETKTTEEKIRTELFPFLISNKKIIVYDNMIALINFQAYNNTAAGKPILDGIRSVAQRLSNKRLLWAVAQFAVNPVVRDLLLSLSGQPDDTWDDTWYVSWHESWDGTWHDSSTVRPTVRAGKFLKPKTPQGGGGGENSGENLNSLTSNDQSNDDTVRATARERYVPRLGGPDVLDVFRTTNSNPLPLSPFGEQPNPERPPDIGVPGQDQGFAAPVAPQGAHLITRPFQTRSGVPSCLYLFVDDTFLGQEISAFISGHFEPCLMMGDLSTRPPEFIKYLFDFFVKEILSKGQDISSGKMRMEFSNLVNYRIQMVEKKFNHDAKDDNWFEAEFSKAIPASWSKEEQEKFYGYYTAGTPSGVKYYRTISNFQMDIAIKGWDDGVKRNASSSKSVTGGGNRRTRNTHSVADGTMSKQEQEGHYGFGAPSS